MTTFICPNCNYKHKGTCGKKICPKCNTDMITDANIKNDIIGFCGKCNNSELLSEVKIKEVIKQSYKCKKNNKIYNKPLSTCNYLDII